MNKILNELKMRKKGHASNALSYLFVVSVPFSFVFNRRVLKGFTNI